MAVFLTPNNSAAQQGLLYDNVVHDFGHVGIDFRLDHKFYFVNNGDQTVKIDSFRVTCDCSSLYVLDSTIEVGDTAWFYLKFHTRDLYGPTNRSFMVYTDAPKVPAIRYFYQAVIGQWFGGIMPKPQSLFFLPNKPQQTVVVTNIAWDEISLTKFIQYDTTFDVEVLNKTAGKSESLVLNIIPRLTLSKGTYHDNLRLSIVKAGEDKPTILTVPVKIVRY